jgi:putative DNA-invertase from lambdoid prophage Rac
VVRWADRLGRNHADVCDTIREFMRRGVIVRTVINNLTFDGATADPMQQDVRDALIAFMAATAQAQAEATKAAQRAEIEHAKASDGQAYLGRKPSFSAGSSIRCGNCWDARRRGLRRSLKDTGLTRQTVYPWRDPHISLSIPAHFVRHPSSESRIGDQEWKMLAIAG